MPCPHNQISIVQRSNRQSAVAAAAYQSGEKLFCGYDQEVKHYPEKRGIVHNEILLPANAPLDRSGNRRFIPVMVYPEQAEVHILEDEAASRAYIEQMWAEAMEIYRSGRFKLAFSPAMQRYLKEHQRDFMPEDTKAGMIQAYLDKYTGSMVCSKQLYKEALNHAFDEPKQWEIREINEIMNQCISGWRYFPNPRMFSEYGRQKGWERENPATDSGNPSEKTMDGFVEVTEQMELPF